MSYCDWDTVDELCLRYHDEEWGVPLHDDRGQFEFLSLEVIQCGLNWTMMLLKREVFRTCFAGFDFDTVAAFGSEDVERILATPGMIRSRRKIEAIINNACCFQRVRAEFGSFDAYLWGFSDGKTILYNGWSWWRFSSAPLATRFTRRHSRRLRRS
ncbi:DNA-3-methyladenine glycosylase I [Collinsella tanakaei]|uniref:DNA-3-methyladenine glycosylase I n=1 Tax=Collinsella tanakaei TaxID=626935 RepID=UPI001F15AA76|nr:DNA-3-methyladenine glycosylase I [Collinsella tanakaei]MCF2621180.1 DNA-3-methyladenine glycosylase I [Collinsella tanakaei]